MVDEGPNPSPPDSPAKELLKALKEGTLPPAPTVPQPFYHPFVYEITINECPHPHCRASAIWRRYADDHWEVECPRAVIHGEPR